MEEDQCCECPGWAGPGAASLARTAPTHPCPCCPSPCQCVCEHQSWLCPLDLLLAGASAKPLGLQYCRALFGTVVLGAAPGRGCLLWAVQQMDVSKTISLEPSRRDRTRLVAPCLPAGRAGACPGRVSSMGWAGEGGNKWSVVARKEQRADRPSFSNCGSPQLILAQLQLSPGVSGTLQPLC